MPKTLLMPLYDANNANNIFYYLGEIAASENRINR